MWVSRYRFGLVNHFYLGEVVHMSIPSSRAEHADSDGRTALHWAVDRGHLHAVELLLEKGAQINAKVRAIS